MRFGSFFPFLENEKSDPFLRPDPLDKAIKSWGYDNKLKAALVGLYEEVSYNVTIAVFKYDGKKTAS